MEVDPEAPHAGQAQRAIGYVAGLPLLLCVWRQGRVHQSLNVVTVERCAASGAYRPADSKRRGKSCDEEEIAGLAHHQLAQQLEELFAPGARRTTPARVPLVDDRIAIRGGP